MRGWNRRGWNRRWSESVKMCAFEIRFKIRYFYWLHIQTILALSQIIQSTSAQLDCITTTTNRQTTRRTTLINALRTSRKTTKTKTTSRTTSWNKHEPCRNGHDVTTNWCKQEPNEPDATSGYKQEQLATFWCKWSRRMRNPFWPLKLYGTKHRFFNTIVCN